ncbi:MAG TPA: UDP-N-acetylmuramate--L-alanine ligase [Candidatus Limnocylindria bacterium]|nr:UDP-N-acetylmuramate--L-alanine ligase [Candidatus Limnocylindria bacterium]
MTRFHVVGIGGTGMSAVARLLMAHGEVSGSDRGRWPLSEALRAHGATVHDTFDASHIAGADIVVRSSAYTEDNPEVAAALASGVTLWKRHDAWRFLAKGKRLVAVAGTHGKTTTTAMTWTALQAASIDASLICGAPLRDIKTNAHVGTSDVLVIEADEYDRVFHALTPTVAIVTNVDHDHVDLFPSRDDYMEAFRTFVGGIPRGGTLLACADDAGSLALAGEARTRLAGRTVHTYGTDARADWRASEPETIVLEGDRPRIDASRHPFAYGFDLKGPNTVTAHVGLNVPGVHNVRNAAAAFAAATVLGADAERIRYGLMKFAGTSRRLEELGRVDRITVVDDYAHHPVEIRAVIAAMRPRGLRVIALFQPHTASRLDAFFEEFVSALREADAAVVAETFASARRDSDARGASRELATRSGAAYARDPDEAARLLADIAQPGDVVLILGAGDIRPAGERLLELLRARTPA